MRVAKKRNNVLKNKPRSRKVRKTSTCKEKLKYKRLVSKKAGD